MVTYDTEVMIKQMCIIETKLQAFERTLFDLYVDLDLRIDKIDGELQKIEEEIHSIKCDGTFVKDQMGKDFYNRCSKCGKHIKVRGVRG